MRTLTRGDALRCAQRLPLAIIFRAFGAVWSTSLCLLCLMWLVFFDPECGWGGDGAGFGGVVGAEGGGCGGGGGGGGWGLCVLGREGGKCFSNQTKTGPKFKNEAPPHQPRARDRR